MGNFNSGYNNYSGNNLRLSSAVINNNLTLPLSRDAQKQIKKLKDAFERRFLDKTLAGGGKAQGTTELKKACKKPLKELIEDIERIKKDIDDSFNFGEMIHSSIGKDSHTALFIDLKDKIKKNASYNLLRVLENEPILEYLFCKAKYFIERGDVDSIYKYIITDGGIKEANDYIIESALDSILEKRKIDIKADVREDILKKLTDTGFSFAEGVFSKRISGAIDEFVGNSGVLLLVKEARKVLKFDEKYDAAIIKFIKETNTNDEIIKDDNVVYYVSNFLYDNINNSNLPLTSASGISDYSIKYYLDELGTVEINKGNVLRAADLYYCMYVGEEIGVFEVIERIRYRLSRNDRTGIINITSRQTLNNLQAYFFDGTFRGKDGTLHRRTTSEDRRKAYLQAFGAGEKTNSDNIYVNTEFGEMWNNLLFEGNDYIDKIRSSQYPELYVSKQGIIQSMEDLQRNLSDSCIGEPTIMSALIHEELDFIIEKFLLDPEISNQVAPGRGLAGLIQDVMYEAGERPASISNLLQIAAYSHMILKDVAEYTQEFIENGENFSRIINNMNALWSKVQNIRRREESYSRRGGEISENGYNARNDDEEYQGNKGYRGNYEYAGNGQTSDEFNF